MISDKRLVCLNCGEYLQGQNYVEYYTESDDGCKTFIIYFHQNCRDKVMEIWGYK